MNYIPHHVIEIGGLVIQVWGLCFSLAIGSGLLWAFFRTPEKLRDETLNLGILIIIAGIIGGRLAFVILHPEGFSRVVDIFKIWNGGLVSYGGMIMAVFAVVIYLKKRGLSVNRFLDIFALPTALSIAITRIGCFLNHCHLGRITAAPWGLKYLNETRHPIALYYSLSALIILVILLILEKKYSLKEGVLVLILGILYPFGRLIADQFAYYQPPAIGLLNNIFLLLTFFSFLYILKSRLSKRR